MLELMLGDDWTPQLICSGILKDYSCTFTYAMTQICICYHNLSDLIKVMELSYRLEDIGLRYKPESMLSLDQTIPESSLLITAVHFPIHLFKINILLCFTGPKRKQVTLLNTVTRTHLEYLRNIYLLRISSLQSGLTYISLIS